jgi:hypothetical protein
VVKWTLSNVLHGVGFYKWCGVILDIALSSIKELGEWVLWEDPSNSGIINPKKG